MEEEGQEQQIQLGNEPIIYSSTGGAVNSVNGYTGNVVLTTSDLENTSDYQTGSEVESAISTAIAGKQDTLTAGENITIVDNVISATGGGATYTAGNGLILSDNEFAINPNVVATQSDLSNKQDILTAGSNITIQNNTISATDTTYTAGYGLGLSGTQFAVNNVVIATQDNVTNLQGQIDALAASSDVTDIVGTYADLQAYDTTHLKDNDIIKVLQDESQNDETTYYRWSTSTQTFTLIGEEGPYYTKSAVDTLLNAKQNTLTAGSNIQINSDTISATDTTYTAGTGLSLTGTEFSVDTTTIATQSDLAGKQNTLTAGSNIQISGDTISATDTTYSNFTGTDGTSAGAAGLVPAPATTDAGKFLKADGTWDTAGGGSGPTVVQTIGSSTTDVMSQNAVTGMIYANPGTNNKVRIYSTQNALGVNGIAIGQNAKGATTMGDTVAIGSGAQSTGNSSIAIGMTAVASGTTSIAMGKTAKANNQDSIAFGSSATASGNVTLALGSGSTTNAVGDIAIGGSATAGNSSTDYRATAIGQYSSATALGSTAIGAYSSASAVGQMDIGSTQTACGYNSSNYRLLTGVYDGQSDHDAANVGQLNRRVIGSLTAAPTTSTAGAVGALVATVESGTGHLYICTDDTGGSYTWQQLV